MNKPTETYEVTVARTGCVNVKAGSKEEAMQIANGLSASAINWADDFTATDAEEVDPYGTMHGANMNGDFPL